MAYIDNATVAKIRTTLKAEYPASAGWKWSVRKRDHSAVTVALMAYPSNYTFPGHLQVNHYHIDKMESIGEKEKAVLKRANEILHADHWDDSDPQVDYFNCAFYVSLHIGKWDKEAVAVEVKAKKKPVRRKAAPKPAPAVVGYGLTDTECKDLAALCGIHF